MPSEGIKRTIFEQTKTVNAFFTKKVFRIVNSDSHYKNTAKVHSYFCRSVPVLKKWEELKKQHASLWKQCVKQNITSLPFTGHKMSTILKSSSVLPIMVSIGDMSMTAWRSYVLTSKMRQLKLQKKQNPQQVDAYEDDIAKIQQEQNAIMSKWSLLYFFATLSEIILRSVSIITEITNQKPLLLVLIIEVVGAIFVLARLIQECTKLSIAGASKDSLVQKRLECASQLFKVLRPLLLIISKLAGWSALVETTIGMLGCCAGLFRCLKETVSLLKSEEVTDFHRSVLIAEWITWVLTLTVALGGLIELVFGIGLSPIFIVLQAASTIISLALFSISIAKTIQN